MRALAVACLSLAAPPALADAPVVDREDVTFRVDIDPATLVIGKRFRIRFELSYPPGTRAYFPETPVTKPFLLLSHGRDTTAVAGTSAGETHALELLPVRLGTSVIAPIEVPYVDPSGAARVARTPEVRIQVAGTLGNEADPQPAGPGEPVPVRVPNTPLVWALSAIGIALLASAIGALGYRRWRAWKDAHRPPPPPRPAHEVARERLAEIEAMGLVEAGDFSQLALLVSEVVREFLGARLSFAGVDMTTWEVLQAVSGRDLGRLSAVELEDFLALCDLVKFAKFTPTPAEGAGLLRRAREAVDKVTAGGADVAVRAALAEDGGAA
ncbi:MAG: hypothetical protein FJ087_12550 [Deltaproteobacteria bacterium]|nr:hypothetical protein [Deltaproteobacteria bacterium]